MAVKAGDRLRLSVWVKHNDKPGAYIVQTDPRGQEGHLAPIMRAVSWKPGEWQKLEFFFLAPQRANTVNFEVFVRQQSPGAKVWVDDFFIGKYPDSPLERN